MDHDDLLKQCQALAADMNATFEPPTFEKQGGPEYTLAEPGVYIALIVAGDGSSWVGTGATAEAAMADLLSRHQSGVAPAAG